jgi:hypothetical protein
MPSTPEALTSDVEGRDGDLVAHLVAAGLAGPVATPVASSLGNSARLVEGHPDYTFGLSDWAGATFEEVIDAMRAAGAIRLEAHGQLRPDGGFIEPAATLDGIRAHRSGLAEFLAAGGGRVLLATGHPRPLGPHYGALARALAAAGCPILRPLEAERDRLTTPDGRPCSISYVDGVAALSYDGGRHHTHRPGYMEAMLDAAGGHDGVDLVIADHGFAGAAIEAGITTLSIADVNDPALPLAQARGRTTGVLLIDDGLDPSLFAPVTEAVLGGPAPDPLDMRRGGPRSS